MEVSTKKSKMITNSTNNISADISKNGQKLEEVTSFKYLGTTLCKDGTRSAEILIRIASAMTAMARLNRVWRCNTISFASKFKLYKSLVTAILLSGCETWTLLADSEKKKDLDFRNQVPEKTSSHPLFGAQDQRPYGSTGTSPGCSQETETCMVLARHTPRETLQNHPSGRFRGWATPWSVEEMLDGQHQRVDITARARSAHKNLLQERLQEDLC